MSYSDLTHELKISVSASGGIFGFSFGGESSYLHYVEDKELSMSFNYFELGFEDVNLNVHGYGTSVLTENGKEKY